MGFVLTRWPSYPDSFISHYLRRSRCYDGIIEFSELGARGAKVERPEGCQTVIDKLVSITGQRRWATPSLCLVLFFLLLIHRVRLFRVRFDVQLARETFVWIVSTSIRWIRIDVRWVTDQLFSIDAFCRFTTRSWSKVLKRSMYAMVSEINLIFSRFRWF